MQVYYNEITLNAMSASTPIYTLLDHTADLGIAVQGSDPVNLFKNAGKAMMHLMIKSKSPKKKTSLALSISGNDLEDLMVRWLGEILYLFHGENLVATDIEIETFSFFNLTANIKAVPFNTRTHKILREIKAVTYHQIKVAEENGLWVAKIIFDL